MRKISLMLVAILSSVPVGVKAAGSDAEVRVSATGLDFVAETVPGLLPKSFSFPSFTNTLMGCPIGGPSELKASGITFKPVIKSLEIVPQSGKIKVVLAASGSGSGTAGVTKIACISGSITCKINATLDHGEATATFTPSIVNGKLKLTNPSVSLNVGDKSVHVGLSSCGIAGSVIEKVVSLFRGYWVDKVEDALEDWVVKEVPKIVEDKIGDMTSIGGAVVLPVGGAVASYDVSGAAKRVSITSAGIGVGADVSIVSTKKVSCYKPLASSSEPAKTTTTPAFSFSSGEHLGVSLSASTLRRTVRTAWQSGLLCFSASRLKSLGLDTGLLGAGAILLGMTGVDTIKARAPRVPTITLVPGNAARADLRMVGFEIVLEGSDASGPVTITATANIKFKIKVDYNPFSGALVIDSFTTEVEKLSVAGGAIDEAMFQQLLESVLVPLIDGELNGLKLVPHVAHQTGGFLDPYYLYISRGKTTTSQIYVYAKIFDRPSSDAKAPSTTLTRKPASVVAPQIFRLLASGYDDHTPSKLLRFAWRVNGGSWTGAIYGRGREVTLEDGHYTIETKATDLNGNTDATPAKVSFDVDGVAPTLDLDQVPGRISTSSLRLGYIAKDDHTPIDKVRVTYKLERGAITALDTAPMPRGATEIVLENLVPGDYKLTAIAEDSVGNHSEPQLRTFIVDGDAPAPEQPVEGTVSAPPADGPTPELDSYDVSGGCALASGGARATGGLPLLALLALALLARRRR